MPFNTHQTRPSGHDIPAAAPVPAAQQANYMNLPTVDHHYTEDDDGVKWWQDFLFRDDTHILILSPKATSIVCAFTVTYALVLHGNMMLYARAKRKQLEKIRRAEEDSDAEGEEPLYGAVYFTNTDAWEYEILLWGVAIHFLAVLFWIIPILCLLSYSPLLWIFAFYFLMGVVFHQYSIMGIKKNTQKVSDTTNIPTLPILAEWRGANRRQRRKVRGRNRAAAPLVVQAQPVVQVMPVADNVVVADVHDYYTTDDDDNNDDDDNDDNNSDDS